MIFDLQSIVRRNIQNLKPYSSARSEFEGSAEVFLDANENSFGSPAALGLNRYPDPLQRELKDKIAKMKGVDPAQTFVGNGSDEAIDLLFRIFCEPGRDEVITCPPTYGMYRVSADINDVAVSEIRLTDEFQLDVPAIIASINETTKLIFVCSPNNPTGTLMDRGSIVAVAQRFSGIVVVDEAYIDFADEPSMLNELADLPNMVILQTFSKSWGMAGVRVGLAFARREVIDLMNRVKPPYNISGLAQRAVVEALGWESTIAEWIGKTKTQRALLGASLSALDLVQRVYRSDANFLLVKVDDANAVYRHLIEEGIVVRNRNNVELCDGCLRITVGTSEENARLLDAFDTIKCGGITVR